MYLLLIVYIQNFPFVVETHGLFNLPLNILFSFNMLSRAYWEANLIFNYSVDPLSLVRIFFGKPCSQLWLPPSLCCYDTVFPFFPANHALRCRSLWRPFRRTTTPTASSTPDQPTPQRVSSTTLSRAQTFQARQIHASPIATVRDGASGSRLRRGLSLCTRFNLLIPYLPWVFNFESRIYAFQFKQPLLSLFAEYHYSKDDRWFYFYISWQLS